jgi:hypothetical protein
MFCGMSDERALLRQLRETPRLFDLIAAAAEGELGLQERLRGEFPDDLVRAALTLADLRTKGLKKFARAESMWLDRRGLEQATPEAVARHKAQRFHGRVFDYCTGIGGDAIALAAKCEVVGCDVDPAACLRAKWNAAAYGVSAQLDMVCADVERLPACRGLLHVDPDRRRGRGGNRSLRVEDAVPGLEALRRLMDESAGGAIKLSPAANFAGKFQEVEIELVSLHGEAKEATIWFGELAEPGVWRATALPAGETLAGDPLSAMAEVTPAGRYVYDPDPGIVRAGLIDLLAEKLGLARLDAAEEYLTSQQLVGSPFVQPFEILAELPNNDRAIRRYFRDAGIGQLEIKCRHIPVAVEAVRRKLRLEGSAAAVLIFARLAGKARALICRRAGHAGG